MSCFITVCFDVHNSFAPEMIFLHCIISYNVITFTRLNLQPALDSTAN